MTRQELSTYKLPDTPGVYFFLGSKKQVLYIGKATSLRDRVRSYFGVGLTATRSPLVVQMVEKATGLKWEETGSVLEALVLEAERIKHHQPHYNTLAKDDKSFNYVVITKEDFPRVLLVRGKDLQYQGRPLMQNSHGQAFLHIFGPFPHGAQLKEALKFIRKIFPYRDTCQKIPRTVLGTGRDTRGRSSGVVVRNRPCFNRSIGLCPGVCSGEVTIQEYGRIVRHLVLFFEGKNKQLRVTIECEMRTAAKAEKFEEANNLKRQIFALNHIQDVSLIKTRTSDVRALAVRIEAYDMAHLSGAANVGVMTVVKDGEAQPHAYRKFIIREASPGDDVGALREVLTRRLGHAAPSEALGEGRDEWPLPRIVVVDGSTAQIRAARAVLAEHGMQIPVVGVVKDERHRPREIKGDRTLAKEHERAIILANAEAHRFAIAFHRKKLRAR